jgi:hypothetical protein
MKTYKKLHESKKVANIHIAKIKERGGNVKQSVQNGKILLEYSFPDEEQIELTNAIFKTIKETDMTASEINEGSCEIFAHDVKKKFPKAIYLTCEDFKELAEENNVSTAKYSVYKYSKKAPKNFKFGEIGHAFLFYNGKFYDSELPYGSTDLFDIPTLQAAIELGEHK